MADAAPPVHLYPLGDAAVVLELGQVIDPATHRLIQVFAQVLDQQPFAGLRECVPAFTTLTVYYDPWALHRGETLPYDQVASYLLHLLPAAQAAAASYVPGPLVEIPVCYGGEFGPDLGLVASHAQLAVDEIIKLYSAPEYLVHMVGFAPGFPYLGGLDARLATPRRAQPRSLVPAGAVGIAGGQTGVYSLPTPGGWQLIGRTPLRLFDASRAQPVASGRPAALRAHFSGRVSASKPMSISVLKPGLLTTVQDLGRPGYQKTGLVVSGALDAVALRTANLLVGNPETAAGLEMTLRGPALRFETAALLALTGADLVATIGGRPVPLGRPVAVRAGAVLAFGAPKASGRAWLAVAGGVVVPLVLGSRATYLRAALGGLAGRALRAGDALPVGEWPAGAQRLFGIIKTTESANWAAVKWRGTVPLAARPGESLVVRALPGPEYAQFAPASQRAFWLDTFTVTTEADRMGCRLSGPALARTTNAELLSSAVTFGTVQVPAGGQPIVLLADRQTTGGYPRLAQVITADLGRLAQALPGTPLRFQPVELAEAQALYLAQEQRLRALARAVYLKSLL